MSKTVNKAIDILETFLQNDGKLGLMEIAELTGLNRATIYRLMSTLTKRGYLSWDRKKGTYSLGLKMLDFSYAVRRNLKFIDFAYLSLNKLAKEQHLSTFLTVVDADSALVIEEIGITDDLRINSPVGKRLPLHCTACGKILLTSLSEEERKAYYRRNTLQSYNKNTITDISQLEKELALVKIEGIAFNSEEYRMGLWVAASPIYNDSGKIIAAAAIMTPISYLDNNIEKFTKALKSCTGEISQIVSRIT
jgi:IclR family KDG regulon transcriptional repressor